jgi:hypothetical protein
MQIVPVNFFDRWKEDARQSQEVYIKEVDGTKLLTELRVATANEEMQLDKHVFTHDLLDALRLSMWALTYIMLKLAFQ